MPGHSDGGNQLRVPAMSQQKLAPGGTRESSHRTCNRLVPVGGRRGCGNEHAAFRAVGHLSGGRCRRCRARHHRCNRAVALTQTGAPPMRGAFFFFAAEERPCRIRIGGKKRAMGHAIGRYTALPALRRRIIITKHHPALRRAAEDFGHPLRDCGRAELVTADSRKRGQAAPLHSARARRDVVPRVPCRSQRRGGTVVPEGSGDLLPPSR
jgi:hypothetical protein